MTLSVEELEALSRAPGRLVVTEADPGDLKALSSPANVVGGEDPKERSPGCSDPVALNAGRALTGGPLDEERMRAAADACYLKARPLDNTDYLMNYRKQMARPFVLRALQELAEARRQ